MSSYERDRAYYEQECREEMIRMRDPQPTRKIATVRRADIAANGPVDGTGARHSDGAYVLVRIDPDGWSGEPYLFRISRGSAEQLEAELHAIMAFDLNRLTGSVIDAYTLAPNDENEKREAVRAAIERGLKP